MIFSALKKEYANNSRLWELIEQANALTPGDDYRSWHNNAPALIPVMKRILSMAGKKEDWQIYFYDMSLLFWLVRQSRVNDIPTAFWLTEMFHQAYRRVFGKELTAFGREWLVNSAADILGFYREYPQIDDEKLAHMLEIYRECAVMYGKPWHNGNYPSIMKIALLDGNLELAEEAAEKLQKADFSGWCYVCTCGRPMLGYYVLLEDSESALEMVSRICERAIPAKYRWCFDKCQQAGEKDIIDCLLEYCIKLGKWEMFCSFFDRWKALYQEPLDEVRGTHTVLFHALAGDWSKTDERLRLACEDDQGRAKGTETPLDSLYFALCWWRYFLLLERAGTKSVLLKLGEADDGVENTRIWLCSDAATYFERQADLLGSRMDRARKRFGYAKIKKSYEECVK